MLTQKKTKAIMLGDTPVKRVMFRDKQIWPELGPAPTNLVGVAGTLKATLTWTSATGESGVTWTEEKLVRKEGSAPQGSMDGTTVATITTKDTYATNGYEDTGLSSETTYYYGVFAVYDNGVERGITTSVTTGVMTTVTVRWNEVDNPADFFLEYADDAEGGVQGSTEFDKFFGYSAVRLNASGVETAEVTQEQSGGYGKLDFSRLGTLTSGDNVMIKFPTLGVKMSKDGSTVTLSFTKDLNRAGFQYYAHQNGSLSSPGAVQSAFYLGAYLGHNDSSVMKSLSGKAPVDSQDTTGYCNLAKANGTGYNVTGFYQHQFVNALYMMKYCNPSSLSVVGKGVTGSAVVNTGGSNDQINATALSSTGQIKLFGLEDWRGNKKQLVGGAYRNGNYLYTMLSGYSGETTGGENTNLTLTNITGGKIRYVLATNEGMFVPSGTASTGKQYYEGLAYTTDRRALYTGMQGTTTNIFTFYWYYAPTAAEASTGARLQYLPVPSITPLNFTAEEANSTVQLMKNGNPTAVNLETSTDGSTWTDYTIGSAITLANVGDKVYMRNKSETDTGFSTSAGNYYQFAMTGKISSSGDVTSLLNRNGTTTLSSYCYRRMFQGCTSLTTAPKLPATILANYCCRSMFQGCTSLTTAPILPATTLAQSCYHSMFNGCTSLTTAPELPATTLANYCYYEMFGGCTSLTTLPELSATTLADNCYYEMFSGCTGIKLSTTQTGEYQIPYRIPTSGTGTVGGNSLTRMFLNTGGTFKATPSINTTYYTSNTVI